MLIQIVAAALLLLGSGLVLHALVALEAPSRPRLLVRPEARRHAVGHGATEDPLSRAA